MYCDRPLEVHSYFLTFIWYFLQCLQHPDSGRIRVIWFDRSIIKVIIRPNLSVPVQAGRRYSDDFEMRGKYRQIPIEQNEQ